MLLFRATNGAKRKSRRIRLRPGLCWVGFPCLVILTTRKERVERRPRPATIHLGMNDLILGWGRIQRNGLVLAEITDTGHLRKSTMKVILSTSSTNPEFNGDCDYAAVELTPALVQEIRRRVALAQQAGQQDDDLYEIRFWGGAADYYNAQLVEACQDSIVAAARETDGNQAACDWLNGLEQYGHALLPAALDLGAHETRPTAWDQIVVRCGASARTPELEIAWTTNPRHTDIEVTTRGLPPAELDAYLRGSDSRTKVTRSS